MAVITVAGVICVHPVVAVYHPLNEYPAKFGVGNVHMAVLYETVLVDGLTDHPSASKVAVTLVGHAAFAKLQLALLPPY